MATFLDFISPQVHRINHNTFTHWASPRRVIYDHELLIISDGECLSDIDGERFVNGTNSFIIKPPGKPHSAVQTSKSQISFHWIHFDWVYHDAPPTDDKSLLCYLPAKPNPALIHHAPPEIPDTILHGPINSPAYALQLFARINERWNFGTPRERASCRALLLELLIELLGDQLDYFAPAAPEARNNHTAEKIRNLLNHVLDEPNSQRFSLQVRLSALGYSYPHLCRVFKKAYGISPITYLNNQRMERACMLLRDTETPISEIAESVGIDNPAYFSRLFAKYTRMSPRDYRLHGEA
jgi:AraC-like DNA-binding protein